jgi:hypothetical protein
MSVTSGESAMSRFDWLASCMWWAAFITATVTLSKVFEASRSLTAGSVDASWPALLGWALLLLTSVMYLGYRSYENLKQKGELGRTWVVYEWLYAKLNQGGDE